MTGNFTEFKIENQVSESWNEQNVMTSTAVCISCIFLFWWKVSVLNYANGGSCNFCLIQDYISTLEASAPAGSSFKYVSY